MITEKADYINNISYKTIVDPLSYPVTIDEIKSFARIDGNDQDALLEIFLQGVIEDIETYLGRALIERTIQMTMDIWNSNEIELKKPPLISVISVNTVDENDVETIYDSNNYYVITESIPGKLIIKNGIELPSNFDRSFSGFQIVYIAGYGDISKVPSKIKVAIMQWVTMIYEDRSMTKNDISYNEPPPEVKRLLSNFRVLKI
jgi:uncharacterized phiE125 gp8 family phage protein